MSGKPKVCSFLDGNRAAALGCSHGWLHGRGLVSDHAVVVAVRKFHRARRDSFASTRRPVRSSVAIVQAEDELAATGMVLGAGWAGARAMTSTSGPGISLMAEWAGYGYYAEVPAVIFDVQRAGPSTGLPTRTMQGDVSFAYTLSHGDTKHIVLLPATVDEAYEMRWKHSISRIVSRRRSSCSAISTWA